MGLFDAIGSFFTGKKGEGLGAGGPDATAATQWINQYNTRAGTGLQPKLNAYALGNTSLADMLKSNSLNSAEIDELASNALTGSKLASEQVQQDPILAQLFGKEGALSRANTEEQDLAKRGYSLQPEDFEAYGQAQDQIARQFGASEQSLAQALANRGLSGGGGVVGSQFSGLYGNKNEQLKNAQIDIAQKRMQMNLDRLNNTRQFMSQLGSQAQGAIQNQFGRNQEGFNQRNDLLKQKSTFDVNAAQVGNQAAQMNRQAAMASAQPGLFDAMKSGLFKGVSSGTEQLASGGMSSMFSPSKKISAYGTGEGWNGASF